MQIIRRKSELKSVLSAVDDKIAFVPTMGCLHDGHLSLIKFAKKKADFIISSIFINPKQFGKNEDFSSYPKTENEDIEKLRKAGVDILYIPSIEEMYNNNFAVKISFDKGLAGVLCGKTRKGFFSGVAIVVLKLFEQIKPNIAIFGEKDYQQLLVIKRLVQDLDLDVNIISGEIVRENSGLAMSSRNNYLSKNEQEKASLIYKTIFRVKNELTTRNSTIGYILSEAKQELTRQGFIIDYLEIRDEENLKLINNKAKLDNARLFIACYLNKTRLIDNIKL